MNTQEIKQAIVRVVGKKHRGIEHLSLQIELVQTVSRPITTLEYFAAILLAIESGEVTAKGGRLWPGEPAWQPIETAPKNRPIFAYFQDEKDHDVIRWNGGGWACYDNVLCAPTHWQELTRPEGE